MNYYTRAIDDIQRLADRLYEGRLDRAFSHWALECLVADLEPTEEDLITRTGIDRTGDLGIDGFWLDDTNSRIVFLQSKFQETASRGRAQELRQAIQSLVDEEYVRTYGNANLREFYPEIYQRLVDEDFPIVGVLAARETVAQAARTWAEGEGSSPWSFALGGVQIQKDFEMRVTNIEGLVTLRNSLLTAATPTPRVTLTVTQTGAERAFHVVDGEFRTIQATVKASDIVDAYGQFRSAIFRYNPRGPQGSNKVNKEIAATLRDPSLKSNFHILNNGLTVVCDSARPSADQSSIEVDDFQVVNGCQTAYTLHSLRNDVTDDVKVTVRIIEGQNWAPLIAKSTNSQTAVRAEQLASLGQEHERLAREFDELEPAWFYERQLGTRRFQSPAERELHRVRYGRRNVTIKEIGQYGAAFAGQPILANYNLKVLFERSDAIGQQLYSNLYGNETHAVQLLFVVLLGRRVEERVRQHLQEVATRLGNDPTRPFSELDWLPYARMHLIALIGEMLRSENPETVARGKLLSPGASRQRRESMDEWFEDAYARAFNTVEFFIEVERTADRLANLRDFFRSTTILARMEERVRR